MSPYSQSNRFRRVHARLCLGICLLSNSNHQLHGFIVGHQDVLHLKQLQYSSNPLVQNTNAKDANFLIQAFDEQTIDSILPSNDTSLQPTLPTPDTVINASAPASLKTKVISSHEPRPFPFSMIIDQEEIKHALLLSAVDYNSIGVLISGETCLVS